MSTHQPREHPLPGDQDPEQRLASFAATYGLAPAIVAAHRPSTDKLYLYPGMDGHSTEFVATMDAARSSTLDYYERHYNDVYRTRGALVTPRDAATIVAESQSPSKLGDIVDGFESTRTYGLRYSIVVKTILDANLLHYCDASDPRSREPMSGHPTYEPLGDTLLDPSEDRTTVTVGELATRLRAATEVDLSEALLTARLKHFLGAAQLGASAMFLSEVYLLRVEGGAQAKTALALAQANLSVLTADSYADKAAMHRSVTRAHEQAVARLKKNPRGRQISTLLAQRSRNTVRSFDTYLEEFGVIYERLGYPLPDILSSERERLARLGLGSAGQPPQPVASQRVERPQRRKPREREQGNGTANADPVLAAKVAAQHSGLLESANRFSPRWAMNSKARRTANLTGVQGRLSQGVTAPTGQVLLDPVEPEAIPTMAACLYRLYELTLPVLKEDDETTMPDARVLLDQALQAENTLRAEWETVQTRAGSAGMQLEPPSIFPLNDHVAFFREHGHGIRELILRAWPVRGAHTPLTVANAIDSLLSQQSDD